MFQKWILPFLLGQLFIIATLEAADVCNDVSKPDEKLYCAAGTTCCNNGDGLCCRNGTICCLKIFCCPTYLTDGAITAIIVIGSVFVLVVFCCAKKCKMKRKK
ncbi:hypothetical protein DPMN_184256 [Dreissena polymorpha]|uniref:Cysteine rich secreted protein n=1 Tax=Dreissena polymorpha TaxID=45954 RepID=A0A9D4DJ69_DREPO|nr:hypothetical protein DPMN_184256 [Dreissena polymorpha]